MSGSKTMTVVDKAGISYEAARTVSGNWMLSRTMEKGHVALTVHAETAENFTANYTEIPEQPVAPEPTPEDPVS
uniref:Uncharacterized protein n=1 Tax=viral metagenome TaxID=1070528 RepID=A0A6M3ITU0_9ZZZZ